MVCFSTFSHWLEALLREKFFSSCLMHETAKKNEKNIFCLDCYTSICPHCLSLHHSHRLLQVQHLVREEGGLLKYLHDCKFLPLPEGEKAECSFYELDDDQMTPDSILKWPILFGMSSGSGASGGVGCRTLACTATTEVVKKKRSSVLGLKTAFRPTCSPAIEMAAHLNRRKGIPHRSPLY